MSDHSLLIVIAICGVLSVLLLLSIAWSLETGLGGIHRVLASFLPSIAGFTKQQADVLEAQEDRVRKAKLRDDYHKAGIGEMGKE